MLHVDRHGSSCGRHRTAVKNYLKAKEIRPLVEKCITIAKKGLAAEAKAVEFATTAERGSDEWKAWRKSDQWSKWADAKAPAITARRRVFAIIRDELALSVLFSTIAKCA